MSTLERILKKYTNCFDYIYLFIFKGVGGEELQTKLAVEAENIKAHNVDTEFCMLSICFPSAVQVVSSQHTLATAYLKEALPWEQLLHLLFFNAISFKQ